MCRELEMNGAGSEIEGTNKWVCFVFGRAVFVDEAAAAAAPTKVNQENKKKEPMPMPCVCKSFVRFSSFFSVFLLKGRRRVSFLLVPACVGPRRVVLVVVTIRNPRCVRCGGIYTKNQG